MVGNQYVVRILLGTALMLCLSGCAEKNNMVPPATAVLQTEISESTTAQATAAEGTTEGTSAPEETETTGHTQTEPAQTEPPATESAQTEPAQTEPTEPPQTEPAQTKPPETEPVQVQQIQAQQVIDRAAAALADRMPEVRYDPSWSGGTVVRLPVPLDQPEEAMADKLLESLVALFSEALAGEDPHEAVEYTYSLAYMGLAEDNSSHLFTASYTSAGQAVEEIAFDSSAVVAQVTQGLLNSAVVEVTAFDGTGYLECVTIKEVPYFYSTQDAVSCLIGAVETEIYTQNILGAEYHEFCLVYDSEEETCHVFLLYLK